MSHDCQRALFGLPVALSADAEVWLAVILCCC